MELFNMFKDELMQNQGSQNQGSVQQIPNLPSNPINDISKQVGEDSGLVGKIMSLGLPLIMGQLNRNAKTEEGSKSLYDALNKHQAADYSNPQNIDPNDGNKILGHIFGDKSDNVSKNIGNEVGADSDKVKQILMYIAPLALAYLANKKKNNEFDEKSIKDYTQNEAEQFDTQMGGTLGNILGGLVDDNQTPNKSGGGLLDILGGLFGK